MVAKSSEQLVWKSLGTSSSDQSGERVEHSDQSGERVEHIVPAPWGGPSFFFLSADDRQLHFYKVHPILTFLLY